MQVTEEPQASEGPDDGAAPPAGDDQGAGDAAADREGEAPAVCPTVAAEGSAEAIARRFRQATTPIRIALALIYFHFGFLKFFPDLSSAEMLGIQTVLRLRLGLGSDQALFLLALFEVAVGLLFALRVSMRVVFPIFLMHMAGTLLPLVMLPELTFKFPPFAPTLEGQYILKNAVVIAAGWALYLAETTPAPARP